MPPQMEEPVGLSGRRHLAHEAVQLEALMPGPANRPQEAACRHIDHVFDLFGLTHLWSGHRKKSIGEPDCPLRQGLLGVGTGAIEPDARIAAKRDQSAFARDAKTIAADLVAREDDALQRHAIARRHRYRS